MRERSDKNKSNVKSQSPKFKKEDSIHNVIPAKAGIQKNTGFRVRPGMTIWKRFMSSCINRKTERF